VLAFVIWLTAIGVFHSVCAPFKHSFVSDTVCILLKWRTSQAVAAYTFNLMGNI
jgi:hypothetical protein